MTLETEGFRLVVPPEKQAGLLPYLGREVILGIRPDDFSQAGAAEARQTIEATVDVVQPVGAQIYLDVKVGDHDLMAAVDSGCRARSRHGIRQKVNLDNRHFFDPATEKAIVDNDSSA